MPPRPSSPRISYLPALVAVTILFQRTDVRRLTSTFSPISPEVNPPSGLVFRSRHGRSLRDQLQLSHVTGHLPSRPFHLSEYRIRARMPLGAANSLSCWYGTVTRSAQASTT